MSARTLQFRASHAAAVAAAAATLALAAAFGYFEAFLGLEACTLCWWQRKALFVCFACGAGALGVKSLRTPLALCALAALLVNAGFAAWHTATELGWIPLLVCESPDAGNAASAFDAVLARERPVRCDRAPWHFLGLSIAGWNLLYSLGAFAACLGLAVRRADTREATSV